MNRYLRPSGPPYWDDEAGSPAQIWETYWPEQTARMRKRADIERRLAYYKAVVDTIEEKLTPADRLAFNLWDDHRPDQVPTSAWPGFIVHGVICSQGTPIPRIERRKQEGPPISSALRWEVWERDDFTCRHCGARRDLVADHVIPRSSGGLTNTPNLQTLCRSCNSKKGAR